MKAVERGDALSASELLADLREWLASGDVQSASGAYCAWYEPATESLAFEYPEITGYALTWLAGRPDPTEREIDAGRRAATWIRARLNAGDRSARAAWDNEAVYTFDLGMIAAGLQSFGKRFGNADDVEQGQATATELAAYVRSDRGMVSVAPDGPPTTRPPEWSTAGVPHLAKSVQGLLLADHHDAARDLIASVEPWVRDGPRFQTQPDDDRTMLHPHLYTVEALWMWGRATDDSGALRQARSATEWIWSHQLESGGLPRYAAVVDGLAPAPEQWDVTAQAVRAAIMTGATVDGLERAVTRLSALARPARVGRALIYQPESGKEHHNSWVSMFGAQALELVVRGPGAMAWHQLV